MSDEIKQAWSTLKDAMCSDFDWAWAVHCNVAIPIMNNSELSHIESNKAAAAVMQATFGYDVTGLQRYQDLMNMYTGDQSRTAVLKERLKKILLEKSYRSGTFTLTSGKTSDFYIDVKQTALSAEGAYLCGKLMLQLIVNDMCLYDINGIKAIGGMTLGADPLVTAASIASFHEGYNLHAFIVRKEAKSHGTNQYIEGLSNLEPGSRVALVEDVVTTGGTLLKVIERVEAQGFRVGLVITIMDRQEGGLEILKDHGYDLRSIFTREELLS